MTANAPLPATISTVHCTLCCKICGPDTAGRFLITETGAEGEAAFGWLGYIAEVRQARRLGGPVVEVCLYPVMDYPAWDDERHCGCGLIEVADDWST
jgi:hypothetical protein